MAADYRVSVRRLAYRSAWLSLRFDSFRFAVLFLGARHLKSISIAMANGKMIDDCTGSLVALTTILTTTVTTLHGGKVFQKNTFT